MGPFTYWGDLHNHCAVSYGHGTPKRALANAQAQLDFCTITGHAFWPDMPYDLVHHDGVLCMHLAGFTKLRHFWPQLLSELAQANRPGAFVTLPSYEWHSMKYGDHNVYVCADELPLLDAESPDQLERALRDAGADPILIPHHIGYSKGHRGANWDGFDPRRTPIVEIYSNHGGGESDDAPYEYHHSMGPRLGESMARSALLNGLKFGFYASTDSHDGYPGHYGHGRVGVIADRLDRKSLWDAIRNRRTIASTGARITADLQLNDAGIGQTARRTDAMKLQGTLEAAAAIDQLDLIEGGGGAWRIHRLPPPISRSDFSPGRHKVRIETGWGRPPTVSHWHVTATVDEGQLLAATPCFRYSGYDNTRQEPCDRILSRNEKQVEWTCDAKPNPAGAIGGTHFNAGGTQSVVLDLEATESTRLKVQWEGGQLEIPIRDLVRQSVGRVVGAYSSAAIKIHRAVPQDEFTCHLERTLTPARGGDGFIYLRVQQSDGQAAWISPIWFE